MITLKKKANENFVVLNLSDTQLSLEEWNRSHKGRKILEYTVSTLIDRVHPDLITISGDLCSEHQDEAYDVFADYFDSLEIPWAPIFGNHDNMSPPEKIDEFADRFLTHTHCIYEKGDEALGNGNFVIKIVENGKPVSAIIMIDSHEVIPFTDVDGSTKYSYESLRPEQIDWYRKQIAILKNEGCNDSTIILHTPIFAYRDATKKAYKESADLKTMKWEESLDEAVWNDGYKESCGLCREDICAPVFNDGVFEVLKELGHTKQVIAGHDHMNNYIINYDGITLIYATKTGIGCYYASDINGGTVFEIGENGIERAYQEMVDITDML